MISINSCWHTFPKIIINLRKKTMKHFQVLNMFFSLQSVAKVDVVLNNEHFYIFKLMGKEQCIEMNLIDFSYECSLSVST